MAKTLVEWARTIRAWYADPDAAAWIRERTHRVTAPVATEDGPTVEFACYVTDWCKSRQDYFASTPAVSPMTEAKRTGIAAWKEWKEATPTARAGGMALFRSKFPDEFQEWYIRLTVEAAVRDNEPWVPQCFGLVERELRTAGIILAAHTPADEPATDDAVLRRDYKPASWFKMSKRATLRKAAGKDRKTKRVRSDTLDGVKVYHVGDVRAWYPGLIPDGQ